MEAIVLSLSGELLAAAVYDNLPLEPEETLKLAKILTGEAALHKVLVKKENYEGTPISTLILALRQYPRYGRKCGFLGLEAWAKTELMPAIPKNWLIKIPGLPPALIDTRTDMGILYFITLMAIDAKKAKFPRLNTAAFLRPSRPDCPPSPFVTVN